MMTQAAQFEFVLGLVAVVLILEIVARRTGLLPSAVLVVGGVVLALAPGVPDIHLDADLILLLFLPPLLFSSAYFTVWRDFRDNLRIILQLAVGAVLLTTIAVGVATHLLMPSVPWAVCFAFGAIVSPPDAVAAKAVLKAVPLPPRLTTLLEGESLVNDATGLVLFRFAIAAGLTGTFNMWEAAGSFGLLAVGGILVGAACGQVAALVLARVQEPHLNIVGGLLVAWGAYIIGDALHVSGVLSTVCCGLVMGWRQHDLLDASIRTRANTVWDVVVFLLESLVFILIGLSLRGVLGRLSDIGIGAGSLALDIGIIALVMIVARFAWIVPATYVPRFLSPALRRRDPYPSLAVPVVMSWAGMRGVVSLAVALSVPEQLPGRDFILAATLSLILLSILVQGTTLAPLIRLLRLGGFQLERRPTLDEAHARVELANAALAAIRSLSRAPDGIERHPRLVEQYAHRADMAARFAQAGGRLANHRDEHFAAVLLANRAARAELLKLHRTGRIHDTVLQALEAELDLEEMGARQLITSDTELPHSQAA
jgi:Na+/H+ antiporter